MSELAPIPTMLPAPEEDISAEFLASHAELTRKAYRLDLDAFARFGGFESIADAARALFGLRHGDANRAAQRWISAMEAAGLASATIRRRCCALRALARFACRMGAVAWRLELPPVRVVPVRDVRGVSPEKFRRLLAEGDAKTRAVVDLLGGRGLRASELCGIRFPEDVALEESPPRVRILGKGRDAREWVALADRTAGFIRAFLAERGEEPGALFQMRYVDLLAACKTWGVLPHGLRHHAAGVAAKKTRGSLLATAAFLRHADVRTSAVYCDNWRDEAGAVAKMVAGEAVDVEG